MYIFNQRFRVAGSFDFTVGPCNGTGGGAGGSETFYSPASDGQIVADDDGSGDYPTARAGAGALTASSANIVMLVGQRRVSGPEYYVWESFINFDVSAVGGAATAATLSLWVVSDDSSTDFDIEVRAHDWGDTLTTADFVAGASLSGKTLLASLTTAGIGVGAYSVIAESGTALRDAIDSAVAGDGILRLIVCSSRTTGNNAPSALESVTFSSSDEAGTTQDPKLVVTW